MENEMKVLITGGAGFIGSNLVRMLTHTPEVAEVRVLDDLSTGLLTNLDGVEVDLVHGSVLDDEALTSAVRGVDSIVHLAAIPSVPRSIADPVRSHEANATGTLRVLEAARAFGVPHVVVASSSSVYGANPKLPKNEYDWTRPMSPYAVSKLATEGYAVAYQYAYGLKTLAFRFFNVYGPYQAADHDYAAVIPKFLDAALNGRAAQVHGDGLQSRDFTFIDTVCSVIREAVVRQISSADPVNLAYGTNTTMLEALDEIAATLGRPVAREHVEERAGDVRASQAESKRLLELFPDILPVSLQEGLSVTANWYQKSIEEG